MSMGMTAARHAREVVSNAEVVIALEALVAAQALDLRAPLQPAAATGAARDAIRARVAFLDADRELGSDIAAVTDLLRTGALLESVEGRWVDWTDRVRRRSVVDHDRGAVVGEAVHPLRVPVGDPNTAVAGGVGGHLGPAVEGPISIEVARVVEVVRAEARELRPTRNAPSRVRPPAPVETWSTFVMSPSSTV